MGSSSGEKSDPGLLRLRVASYNVHRCVGTDRLYLPRRTAEVIRMVESDLVGLQEVDSRMAAIPGMAQLDFLALLTGFQVISGPCFEDQKGCFGNALLTRLPIVSHRLVDLSVSGREPRGMIDAVLAYRGLEIRVLVTHLGRTGRERRFQVDRLEEVLDHGREKVTILLGDFNEWWPKTRCSRRLRSCVGRRLHRPTYPSLLPILSLDHIWVLPENVRAKVQVHSSPLAQLASDHLPIRAEIEWDAARPDRHGL